MHAYVRRWTALLAVAAQRALAASPLQLQLFGETCVDGAEPPVSDLLADARWANGPAPSRLPVLFFFGPGRPFRFAVSPPCLQSENSARGKNIDHQKAAGAAGRAPPTSRAPDTGPPAATQAAPRAGRPLRRNVLQVTAAGRGSGGSVARGGPGALQRWPRTWRRAHCRRLCRSPGLGRTACRHRRGRDRRQPKGRRDPQLRPLRCKRTRVHYAPLLGNRAVMGIPQTNHQAPTHGKTYPPANTCEQNGSPVVLFPPPSPCSTTCVHSNHGPCFTTNAPLPPVLVGRPVLAKHQVADMRQAQHHVAAAHRRQAEGPQTPAERAGSRLP